MNINIFLLLIWKGKRKQLNINLSDTIGKKKKELNQSNSFWKYDGEILKDDRTYESYGIEGNETIFTN